MPGSIDPLREQFDAFKALPRDQPIQMLNLIRLKPMADYPAGHPDHGINALDAFVHGRHTFCGSAPRAKCFIGGLHLAIGILAIFEQPGIFERYRDQSAECFEVLYLLARILASLAISGK